MPAKSFIKPTQLLPGIMLMGEPVTIPNDQNKRIRIEFTNYNAVGQLLWFHMLEHR